VKFKLDENIGRRGLELLRSSGHDVATVWDQGLHGASDERLFDVCAAEGRVLVTLDRDFGQVPRFPPVQGGNMARKNLVYFLVFGSPQRAAWYPDDYLEQLALCLRSLKRTSDPSAFDLLLGYAVSEDGALHAEKYYRTVTEEFAATRPSLRWRQLVALARVTASEYGHPAPGVTEARELLKV